MQSSDESGRIVARHLTTLRKQHLMHFPTNLPKVWLCLSCKEFIKEKIKNHNFLFNHRLHARPGNQVGQLPTHYASCAALRLIMRKHSLPLECRVQLIQLNGEQQGRSSLVIQQRKSGELWTNWLWEKDHLLSSKTMPKLIIVLIVSSRNMSVARI